MARAVCTTHSILSIILLFVHHAYSLSVEDGGPPWAADGLQPASDFKRYSIIKPRLYHGRERREIPSNRDESGNYAHHLIITYELDDKTHTLDLQLNRDLIPKGFFIKEQKGGRHVVNTVNKESLDLCHYHGHIQDIPNSWAALSTCNDTLKGVVYDGEEFYYLDSTVNDNVENVHFLYRHSDLVDDSNKTCGYVGHSEKDTHTHSHTSNRILRHKRSTESSSVRGPYNANKQSRYVELVLVIDNREYKEMGENTAKVEKHCKDIANIINGLFAPLNIFIALVGVVIWTEYDEIEFLENGDTTLTNFLHYRREKLIKQHPNDNAQLLTKYVFANGVVGKALKGPICTIQYSGGVSTDHSPVVGLVATTVAHEMGHNFGMEHDTNECNCPDDRCIMAPSSSSIPPSHWSSCSLEYLALAFEHGMDYCLRNKPVSLFDSPICGNGFVEPGEQCDCGLSDTCDNPCCDSAKCTLFSNATCATGECCDLTTCRPKMAGTQCRTADYECDLPEFCTGQSEYCPPDIYKMDTELCDGGKAYCYNGFCRTRSDQCKLLWGETGKSSDDQCYNLNTKGSKHGNCGYNKLNESYFKCNGDDIFCGMLHCKHLNERLEFGMESVAILSHSFINVKGNVEPCRTALVDLGINQIDPGLSPDGAKCGEGKMCVNQRCMSVDSLRLSGHTCEADCGENGVCNSLGHCHCKKGYSPPDCVSPGPGGSFDSGPASDPDAGKEFVIAIFIIFLGIVPLLASIGLFMYCRNQDCRLNWNPTKKTSTSPSKPRRISSLFQPTDTKPVGDDHSLLQDDNAQISYKNDFFGKFKGFSLTPLKQQEPEPVRAAPPVPSVPALPNVVIKSPNLQRSATSAAKANFLNNKPVVARTQSTKLTSVTTPPALPPLNPGANPRPIISSPILENSTCTAKELVSPLRNVSKMPSRPAPIVPSPESKRPLSSPECVISLDEEVKKPVKEEVGTLNRIASFLKKSQSNTNNTLTRSSSKVKAAKVPDKNMLRSLEISNPIPQTEIEMPKPAPDTTETRPVVMRAHSMRGGKTTRTNIPNFGSMRNPSGFKRPVSIPAAHRPKSPPPPRPPLSAENGIKLPDLPGYRKPTETSSKTKQSQYDDCLSGTTLKNIREEGSPTSDNIYAVIDEPPSKVAAVKTSPTVVVAAPTSSNDSAGLLGEIVSEIQNRNLESIYSTSTLARKKREKEEKEKIEKETYVNYKVPDSTYSNMNSSSSTSSGYINPSMVNPPVKLNAKVEKATTLANTSNTNLDQNTTTLSTFKKDKPEISQKPYTSMLQRNQGPLASSFRNNRETTPTRVGIDASKDKAQSKLITRQTTPPNLRTRKASPTRAAPSLPKTQTKSNSPDLVTSCANSNTDNSDKSPDVLANGVKKPATNKPVIKAKGASLKLDTKEKTKPSLSTKGKGPPALSTGTKLVARHNSNVAALQQRFENKNPAARTGAAKK